jgi:hypothetical protein
MNIVDFLRDAEKQTNTQPGRQTKCTENQAGYMHG